VCPVCLEKVDLRQIFADRPWETRNLTWCAQSTLPIAALAPIAADWAAAQAYLSVLNWHTCFNLR